MSYLRSIFASGLVRNIGQNVATSAFLLSITLFTTPLMTRIFPPEAYGNNGMMIRGAIIVSGIGLLGLPIALARDLRQTCRDGVTIALRRPTITIARGKRAAQIQVLKTKPTLEGRLFLVSLRRNETFHMRPAPVDKETMADLVDKMVGDN